MGKLWICVLLVAVATVKADDDNNFPDTWDSDYVDDAYDYDLDGLDNEAVKTDSKNENLMNDKKVAEEIASYEDKKKLSDDGYQVEDNRSNPKDDTERLNDEGADEDEFASEEDDGDDNEDILLDEAAVVESKEKTDAAKKSLEKSDEEDIEVKDKKSEETLVEGKKADTESNNEDEEDIVDAQAIKSTDTREEADGDVEIEKIVDAVDKKKKTEEVNDEEIDDYVEEAEKHVIEMSKDEEYENIEGDTIDQVYDDLNDDLDKLMETWRKLSSDNEEPDENADDSLGPLEGQMEKKVDDEVDISDRETKTSSPADDMARSTVKSDDTEASLAKVSEKDDSHLEKNEDEEIFEDDADDVSDEEDDDDEDTDDDEFSDKEDTIDKVADTAEAGDIADKDDIFADKETNDTTKKEEVKAIPYLADAISPNIVSEERAAKMMNVSDLNPEQYNQIMQQFKMAHAEELDYKNNDFGRNVAPVRITLSLDEATVVTSPNYPMPYPTNNIVDWIFTGDGVGIEMNITSFFVNGALGDYLLVKPGGVDATGTDGIVFSYRLNEPRRYRFLNVDQMFVRFQAMQGMPFTRGFMFTAKMISPRPELTQEEEPEPEPVIPTPVETMTLFIGGMTLPEFRSIEEDFRLLIADMATFYITANNIPLGLNTTRETTQIIRTAPCNIHWPEYDQCAEVTFGVPLVFEEESEETEPKLSEVDLRTMWFLYSEQDPFAARLQRMNIVEFTIPNDSGILTVWVVIALAVLICMALLAFAMWRFSCFDNYTRMPSYSDRDSTFSDKQGLDLYPTPHQTLPPLYAENEYKWDDEKFEDSARVDMGGFTNKSYTRDMYDIDSDEDVIKPRDSNGFSPRGMYEV